METLDKALDRISRAVSVIAGVALVLMMVHVTLDVLGKYLLNRPVPMTLEMVSNYYMVAVIFLPLAAVERLDQHIHVELLAEHLSARARSLLTSAVCVLSAAFFGVLAWQAWDNAVGKYEIGEFIMGTRPVVIWPTRFLVPFGCGLLALVLLVKAVRLLRAGQRPGDGEPSTWNA
jgi:TRAP-type C4-dicarboxylate transport system permease small subunit